MPLQSKIKIAAALLALLLSVTFVRAWLADRRDRDRLNAELAEPEQLLSAANDRQRERDAQLNQTLAAITSEKQSVRTPEQFLRDLPHELPLPAPISLQPPPTTNVAPRFGIGASSPASQSEAAHSGLTPGAPTPQAVIPAEDLKPLYDFVLDCKACQAKLATAESDLADEKSKTAALAKERDEALQVARGGSVFRRIRRAAKWSPSGAAAGAVAAKAAH